MERKDWNRIGLAAAVVLVPGGFLLGAVLAARHYRGRAAEGEADQPDASEMESAKPPTSEKGDGPGK